MESIVVRSARVIAIGSIMVGVALFIMPKADLRTDRQMDVSAAANANADYERNRTNSAVFLVNSNFHDSGLKAQPNTLKMQQIAGKHFI